jgi:hypothetical protein
VAASRINRRGFPDSLTPGFWQAILHRGLGAGRYARAIPIALAGAVAADHAAETTGLLAPAVPSRFGRASRIVAGRLLDGCSRQELTRGRIGALSESLKLTGPNLLAPKVQRKRSIIKQFGRLISA